MNGVTLKIDDKVIDYNDKLNYSLENDSTNIALSHHEKTGFGVSIFDKETNIIRYYKVVDSELVFESANNVMTGEEL
jgi:hypothetical protein